ncbi:MAG TPA: ribose-phosphate pyrophosphokinase-like domain-containing protein, partial [Thermomicrobiaceae bacterium]|nr:ribose-phosphate pyrophosphokinase-like domain-containing protein [Thermomicrobiaceae bacterium]
MSGLYDQLTVFGGNSNPDLTRRICSYIDIPPGRIDVFTFSNENIFVRIGESVRENDVFVIQSLSHPVNESIMELLIIIDTLKRSSSGRITAVIPYFGYGRTDKKDQPRVPITARLIADMIT